MKNAVIQFSTTGGFFAKGIQWRTWSWASHVDVVTSDGTLIGADWKTGVSERDFIPEEYERVERYEIEGVSQEMAEALIAGELGKEYDFGAIFGFMSRVDKFQNHDKWFCSELVAWVFEQAGRPLLNPVADVHTLSPGHLLLSPLLKRVAVPGFQEDK